MGLPKLNTVEYFGTLPISKIEVKYRPFNVKEQKILLQSLEEGEVKGIQHGLISLLRACCDLQDSRLKIEQLSNTDLEWLFINIRMKSVGETTKVMLGCHNQESCDGQTPITIDFNEMKIEGEIGEEKVQLNDKVGVVLRVPSYKDIQTITNNMKNPSEEAFSTEVVFQILNRCIVQIFDENTVHDASDFSGEEIDSFIDDLTLDQFNKMMEWYESVPKMVYNAEFKCDKCGLEQSQELTGLQSFFA